MKAHDQNKKFPIPIKYMSNKPKIIEHCNEESEDINANKDSDEKQNDENIHYNKIYQKNKPSKVYFYCPYNQSYTKFQNYNIEEICELIKKYELENYFIIQIDNDNLLYEEILKMQFKNESQIIHKMFDLKLDYSFSPFQDSLFFNMSILTDFFYDQIEKYLIQIFFHNHGIYIINKDSCEKIHQIIMEKFIFYFVESSEFFKKSVIDKNNKFKSTKILINDFKLKNIINKFQEVENFKAQKKHGNESRSFGISNKNAQKRLGSFRDNSNKMRFKRISNPDQPNFFNKNQKNFNYSGMKDKAVIPKVRSLNNLNKKDIRDGNNFIKINFNKILSENKNYDKFDLIRQDLNQVSEEIVLKESRSQIQFNDKNNFFSLFNEQNNENLDTSNIENQNNNIIFNNYDTSNFKNSFKFFDLQENSAGSNNNNELKKNLYKNQNVKANSNPDVKKSFINSSDYFKEASIEKSNSDELEMPNQESSNRPLSKQTNYYKSF